METEKYELRLTDITRYQDVETGVLELTMSNMKKRWKVVWLTNIRFGASRNLPRGDLTLRYRHYRGWIDCPRVSLNRQCHVWLMPLDSSSWADFGANLYLCSQEGWPHALPTSDYLHLVDVLSEHGVDVLTVEEPLETKSSDFLSEEIL